MRIKKSRIKREAKEAEKVNFLNISLRYKLKTNIS